MTKTYKPLIAVALTLGVTACGPRGERAVNTTANETSEAATDVGNATSNAYNAAVEAVTPTPSGQDFADKAAKSDAFEVAAGKLALDHAASAKVKDFARMMVSAHTESTAKVKAAAAKATPAITPDATLTDSQNGKLADLGKLNGAEFDRSYISGQVDAHEDALSLMHDYAKDGDVAPLKKAAGEIEPVVQKHLDQAKALKSE
jgi:putative membrane protein